MPKKLERKLKQEAKERHYGKKHTNEFVYGTLRKLGWTPKKGKRKAI
jgi:transposase